MNTPTTVNEIAPLLLKSKDAANYLAISERTLWGLADSGEIKKVTIGRAVRYDVRQLTSWVDRQLSTNDNERS